MRGTCIGIIDKFQGQEAEVAIISISNGAIASCCYSIHSTADLTRTRRFLFIDLLGGLLQE